MQVHAAGDPARLHDRPGVPGEVVAHRPFPQHGREPRGQLGRRRRVDHDVRVLRPVGDRAAGIPHGGDELGVARRPI
ncbi:hypothetical protein ADK67_18010 [Saccharothrix sp. NRRL B-16348]|nr:hypothetical protein ADK67_18010 [Saccharothrix sp. NRRL B-16348]